MSGLTRRRLLESGLALPAIGLANGALARAAQAAAGPGDDYRALVCVFLNGGMDGHDTLIPTSRDGYKQWAALRGPILGDFAAVKRPRERDTLHDIGTDESGQELGLPPDMPRTAGAIMRGDAAMIANVGPMLGPVSRADMKSGRADLPSLLFSHEHQAGYWQQLAPEADAPTGWGGRLAEAATTGDAAFRAVGTGIAEQFLVGRSGASVGVTGFKERELVGSSGSVWRDEGLADILNEHLTTVPNGAGVLERDYLRTNAEALSMSARLASILGETQEGQSVSTGGQTLSQDLAIVAKMIALRKHTGARRQVFFASMGGFDTHQRQGRKLGPLQAQLDDGLHRFTTWLERQGLADAVTVFTASEFGRTLAPAATGTDHGWGNHAIVWGGAVRGGRIYGNAPPPAIGHELDAGRGRLIPGLSVEQLGVPLARWLGVPEADMDAVFPYASRFDVDALDLMRT